MKKKFMDKFLEMSFKIGKFLSSFLLIIVLLVILGAGIVLINSTQQKVETPKFKALSQEINEQIIEKEYENEYNEYEETSNDAETDSSSNKYLAKIKRIVKNNHLHKDVIDLISNVVLDELDEKYINQYLDGFDKFCKEGLKELESSNKMMDAYLLKSIKTFEKWSYGEIYSDYRTKIKEDGVYNIYISKGLLVDYSEMFEDAINNADAKMQEKIANRMIAASTLGIALLVFVILLFLPVLIKIEENTRKELPEESNNLLPEDMKKCPNCGKQIKIDAKKCRYCGTWLESNQSEGEQ